MFVDSRKSLIAQYSDLFWTTIYSILHAATHVTDSNVRVAVMRVCQAVVVGRKQAPAGSFHRMVLFASRNAMVRTDFPFNVASLTWLKSRLRLHSLVMVLQFLTA